MIAQNVAEIGWAPNQAGGESPAVICPPKMVENPAVKGKTVKASVCPMENAMGGRFTKGAECIEDMPALFALNNLTNQETFFPIPSSRDNQKIQMTLF